MSKIVCVPPETDFLTIDLNLAIYQRLFTFFFFQHFITLALTKNFCEPDFKDVQLSRKSARRMHEKTHKGTS